MFRTLGVVGGIVVAGLCAAAMGGDQVSGKKARVADQQDAELPLETPDDPPGIPAVRGHASSGGRNGSIMDGFPANFQVNVDADGENIVGDAANEPSIAVDPTNPNIIVIGWRQFDTINSNFRQAGYAYSHDAGRSWTFPGVHEPGVFRSDPVLDSDSEGNIIYYSLRGDFFCHVFWSSDGGVSWTGPIEAFGGDKAWMTIDKTESVGQDNAYVAWSTAGNNFFPNQFTRSTDGGLTWVDLVEIPPRRPRWGTLAVEPGGDLYVSGTASRAMWVAKSTNAKNAGQTPSFGSTVQVNLGGVLVLRAGPNPDGLLGQAWVAVDSGDGPMSGNVYLLASIDPAGNDPLDVMFARSEDGGQTWSAPVRVNDDSVGTNAWQWFGTMSVAPNGRIDVIWNDTRNSGQTHISELFYSASDDGGRTWSQNTQLSASFDSFIGWPRQNKLGDYYDMVSDNVGASLAWAATFNGEQDVYYLRIGDFDCNGNGIGDGDDIASGTSTDVNGNGIPDECESIGDLNCDGSVDALDIEPFLAALFQPQNYPSLYPDCDINNGDLNGDGSVDALDIEPFLVLLFG